MSGEYENCGWVDADEDLATKECPIYYAPTIMSHVTWRKYDGKNCTCYECKKEFVAGSGTGAIVGYYLDSDGEEERVYEYYCEKCIDLYSSLESSGYEPHYQNGYGSLAACVIEHTIIESAEKRMLKLQSRGEDEVKCGNCKFVKKVKYGFDRPCSFEDSYNSCERTMFDDRYCGNWELGK